MLVFGIGESQAQAPATVQISFSTSGGFYSDIFDLTMTVVGAEDLNIFYTTDGTIPTLSSIPYESHLAMSNDLRSTAQISQIQVSPDYLFLPPDPEESPRIIVVTAAAFSDAGERVSAPFTHSYIIGSLGMGHGDLPVLSIAVEQNALFDADTGIFVPGVHWLASNAEWSGNYYQRGSDWEREMHVEFYEPSDNAGFRTRAGMRTHGGNSRRFPQKGLRLYARSEYGASRFIHPVFDEKPINSFNCFVLRPFMSSWSNNGIDDILSNRIAANLNIEYMASRTVIVYINGEYWGLYTMQERPDERYLQDNTGIHPNNVDLISSWFGEVVHGDGNHWFDLYSDMEEASLSDPDQYAAMTGRIDMENFIDYQIFQIFISNYDWPANNMRCWRDRNSGGKWRWIFFDGDAALQACFMDGFAHALDTTEIPVWPTNAIATLFLRRFFENNEFRETFMGRFESLINDQLSLSYTNPLFEQVKSDIEDHIPLQIERFGNPLSVNDWEEDMLACLDFLSCRPYVLMPITLSADENDAEEYQLHAHPNPTSNHLILGITGREEDKLYEYQIFDMQGKLVLQGHLVSSETVIEMNSLAPSMYILNLFREKQKVEAIKIIKTK